MPAEHPKGRLCQGSGHFLPLPAQGKLALPLHSAWDMAISVMIASAQTHAPGCLTRRVDPATCTDTKYTRLLTAALCVTLKKKKKKQDPLH